MDKIIIHIRPIDWTYGDLYGVSMRLSDNRTVAQINWGDGSVKNYYGNEINAYHSYPKDELLSFIVTITILSGKIDYINPTGGDCDYEIVDFSNAPSIKEIYAERCRKVILDNPNLEKMTLLINLAEDYDISHCPNLRDLTFQCENGCASIDLSHCHRLESFSCRGYCNPKLRKIAIANDAPLRHIEICGHNLHPSCLAAIHRIIERNGGEIIDDFENEKDEED